MVEREGEGDYGRVNCVSVPSGELSELNRAPSLPHIQPSCLLPQR